MYIYIYIYIYTSLAAADASTGTCAGSLALPERSACFCQTTSVSARIVPHTVPRIGCACENFPDAIICLCPGALPPPVHAPCGLAAARARDVVNVGLQPSMGKGGVSDGVRHVPSRAGPGLFLSLHPPTLSPPLARSLSDTGVPRS